MEPAESYARRPGGYEERGSGRSTKRSNTAQRVALLAAEALGPLYSIAVHRRDGAALQALCVGSQWRRRVSDRSVMASVRDSKRESLLLVLLMTCVYEATHAAFDLGKGQQPPCLNTCKRGTHSSDLLAATVTFGMSKSNLKMAGEVIVVWRCKLVQEFF